MGDHTTSQNVRILVHIQKIPHTGDTESLDFHNLRTSSLQPIWSMCYFRCIHYVGLKHYIRNLVEQRTKLTMAPKHICHKFTNCIFFIPLWVYLGKPSVLSSWTVYINLKVRILRGWAEKDTLHAAMEAKFWSVACFNYQWLPNHRWLFSSALLLSKSERMWIMKKLPRKENIVSEVSTKYKYFCFQYYTEANQKQQGPIRHKPWPLQTVQDCQDNIRLSRPYHTIHTVKTISNCQDCIILSRQLRTVKTVAYCQDSCRLNLKVWIRATWRLLLRKV